MNIKRLLKYSKLILKGSIEAHKQIRARFEEKKQAISTLKEEHYKINEIVPGLINKTNLDIKLGKRVLRWLDTKDNKEAVKLLKCAFSLADDIGIKHQVKEIVNISKKDEKLIRKLNSVFEDQLILLKDANSYKTNRFIKKYERLVDKQKSVYEELLENSKETKAVVRKIRPRFVRAAAAIGTFTATVLAQKIANAMDSGPGGDDIIDPTNPISPLYPDNLDLADGLLGQQEFLDSFAGGVTSFLLVILVIGAIVMILQSKKTAKIKEKLKKFISS